MHKTRLDTGRRRAIAMWDFSWLERRWPGAGYEDIPTVLQELKERGYDTVRIDPFPHLFAVDPTREWELVPCWNQQTWGSPGLLRTTIEPQLTEFLRACRDTGMEVALSSWFRQDSDDVRMRILTPADFAEVWLKLLRHIESAGFMDIVYYLDLCNEWPQAMWAPFFDGDRGNGDDWRTPDSQRWMRESVEIVRAQYPDLPLTFSFSGHLHDGRHIDLSYLDLLEPHIWMSLETNFYQRLGVGDTKFDPAGLERIALGSDALYRSNPEYFQAVLRRAIRSVAEWSQQTGLPVVTTECWALVDYKDGPMFDWGWVKELCAVGVAESAATERWAAIGTSNFCGPQFPGMWRDAGWHRQMAAWIHGDDGTRDGATRHAGPDDGGQVP
jgi:sugar phosphate isomerase/epimerase